VRRNIPGPLEAFETWPLRRVAQAVEAGALESIEAPQLSVTREVLMRRIA